MSRLWLLILGVCLLASCHEKTGKKSADVPGITPTDTVQPVIDSVTVRKKVEAPDTETEAMLRTLGLVDISEIDPSIEVYLIYATPDNFAGKVLYQDLRKAFMLPETARRLANAQQGLKAIRPDLGLIVYDAVRPMSVQMELWKQVRGTDKRVYVSNPANGGGLHNYGAAVDVSLINNAGNPLKMGSPVDYFGDEARPDREIEMMKQQRITYIELRNRQLLRKVMTEAGFRVLPSEWWHFGLMSREQAKESLKVIL